MPKAASGPGPIVILGATGNQGSAVLQHVYALQQTNLYAVTRDVNGLRAKQVEHVFRGCSLMRADLEDPESLKACFQPIDGRPVSVFAISTPSLASNGYATSPELEAKTGIAMIEAAKEAGVGHFVYSSVCSCDEEHAPAYFKSKLEIEEALESSGLKYTILRPATFIEVWERVHPICKGKVSGMVSGKVRQQWVSLKDIGAVGALALHDLKKYGGKTIDLVGDEASGNELAQVMSRIRGGQPFSYSVAWFTRWVMFFLASMIYEERVTFQNKGGFSGELKQLKAIADKFPDEFKRKGPITFERCLMLAGYDKKELPRVKGLGATLMQFAFTAIFVFGAGYLILPMVLPTQMWADLQRRWAFYTLCCLLLLGLLMQFLASRSRNLK